MMIPAQKPCSRTSALQRFGALATTVVASSVVYGPLLRFQNLSLVGWLNGAIIVLVYFGEGIQLGFGDIDWSFEHIPGDSLGTGRSGERTGERIVASSGREEILGVDGNGRDFDDFPSFRGKILPESIEERGRIRIPFEKYGNDRKVAICVRVDEVGD